MSATVESPGLRLSLESFQRQLTPAAAQAIVGLHADEVAQKRYDELADKSREGRLTDAERRELEGVVEFERTVALLKAHAALALKRSDGWTPA